MAKLSEEKQKLDQDYNDLQVKMDSEMSIRLEEVGILKQQVTKSLTLHVYVPVYSMCIDLRVYLFVFLNGIRKMHFHYNIIILSSYTFVLCCTSHINDTGSVPFSKSRDITQH